jgi:ribosomal protein S27AE
MDKKKKYDKVECRQCGREVELKEHINKCKCGAITKLLKY